MLPSKLPDKKPGRVHVCVSTCVCLVDVLTCFEKSSKNLKIAFTDKRGFTIKCSIKIFYIKFCGS